MDKYEARFKLMQEADPHVLKCDQDNCGHIGRPFIKMGGLICEKCRIILKLPHTPEYKAFLKEQRES